MRKLLVASQKGGVGRTTTSVNLAAGAALAGARVLLLDADPLSSISNSLGLSQHAGRQALRAAGVDLPGALVTNLVPGLDVLSPYEVAGCGDEEMEDLLRLLTAPSLAECYNCLIVDTPPFLGASPAQLLATSDEYVLVMRAEPLAARTLPAFLELVQRSHQAIKMRGILLTLPEGENPGGRWERELRGRFGTRVLSGVIPHDEAVSQAEMFGQIVCHATPDAPPPAPSTPSSSPSASPPTPASPTARPPASAPSSWRPRRSSRPRARPASRRPRSPGGRRSASP